MQIPPVVRTLAGRRADWHLVRPHLTLPRRLSFAAVGPLAVVLSVVASWPAFTSARGEGSVALGLFVGATSIVLMSWSFLLALRVRWMEPMFGGLDRMYRVHRWAGTLAVLAMFLHTTLEPEIDGGIRGAAESVADGAAELAGVAEVLLYVLVAISLVRWVPYRYWRLTHKLLGVPYLFACWHFFTAEKPYANGSGWGWWFGVWMVLGAVAYVWRVAVGDGVLRGVPYRVASTAVVGPALEVSLQPEGRRRVQHRAGQFAFIRVQSPGLGEPHPFTIASPPDAPELRFAIGALGDWSQRLQGASLDGVRVLVDGPYGPFRPLAPGRPMLWVAGGVGITPFLAAVGTLQPEPDPAVRPTLVYCVATRDRAIAVAELERAAAEHRITLSLHVSREGTRLVPGKLAGIAGRGDLRGVHVSVCGPAALVNAVAAAAASMHAARMHREEFEIRSGFGPDLSREIDALVRG